MNVKSRTISITLFAIYLILLCWILVLKLGVHFSYMSSKSYNLIPFVEIFTDFAKLDKAEIILNVLIFIPVGVYTALIFEKRSLKGQLLLILFISSSIEVIQFIVQIGAFDSTDIVTNTVGGLLGIALLTLIQHYWRNRERAQRWINFLAALLTIIFILLLVLLKMGKLPIRYQ